MHNNKVPNIFVSKTKSHDEQQQPSFQVEMSFKIRGLGDNDDPIKSNRAVILNRLVMYGDNKKVNGAPCFERM